MIIILRNPVDRITSEYRFVQQNNLDPEKLALPEAIEKEEERKKNNNLL